MSRGWLRHEIERSGHVWTENMADLEGGVSEFGTREMARHLRNALRIRFGIFIDTDQLVRTQAAIDRGCRQFDGSWSQDALIYRQTGGSPCIECLRLHLNSDGTPKLYRVGDIDVPGAWRPNRGPRRKWTARMGPVHRNCVCAPWAEYSPELGPLFQKFAPANVQLMRELGVID